MLNPTWKQRGPITLAGTPEPEPAIKNRPNEPDARSARTNPAYTLSSRVSDLRCPGNEKAGGLPRRPSLTTSRGGKASGGLLRLLLADLDHAGHQAGERLDVAARALGRALDVGAEEVALELDRLAPGAGAGERLQGLDVGLELLVHQVDDQLAEVGHGLARARGDGLLGLGDAVGHTLRGLDAAAGHDRRDLGGLLRTLTHRLGGLAGGRLRDLGGLLGRLARNVGRLTRDLGTRLRGVGAVPGGRVRDLGGLLRGPGGRGGARRPRRGRAGGGGGTDAAHLAQRLLQRVDVRDTAVMLVAGLEDGLGDDRAQARYLDQLLARRLVDVNLRHGCNLVLRVWCGALCALP